MTESETLRNNLFFCSREYEAKISLKLRIHKKKMTCNEPQTVGELRGTYLFDRDKE